jgi:hypothetical protein
MLPSSNAFPAVHTVRIEPDGDFPPAINTSRAPDFYVGATKIDRQMRRAFA